MSLIEVIVHLKKQISAETLTGETMATCSSASQNAALKARQGSEYKDGCTNSWEITQVKDNITNPENEIVSLLIPEENCPRPEEGGVSWENTHNSRRARLGTCKLQEESSKASSYQDVPVDVGPGFFSSQTSPPLNLSLPITAMTETPLVRTPRKIPWSSKIVQM
ncbi:zinc finger and SCAN domain-containing protein 4-like [Heterocephalus glaber]|uniref:Zinc finger and SCAN domain-containing protein 4-like n=1 Tax=Heterocephalus glaber TaxID=10181 RepID=A0AAX6R936_HETGA|nr:zinc finger and SCAN domain-containing protein 4-like [Heterocephalus glaber]